MDLKISMGRKVFMKWMNLFSDYIGMFIFDVYMSFISILMNGITFLKTRWC